MSRTANDAGPIVSRERLGVCSATAADAGEMLAQGIERQPFVIVWDSQVLDTGQLGIVAGTRNLKTVLD